MPVRPPSLRSIAALEAAARHQSFTRAAEELNLTTGAISHAVKALEHRLGCKLFVRDGRRVALTAEGRTLVGRIRLSLALLSDAFDVTPWVGRNTIIVSTLPSIAEKILLPALGSLQSALPDVVLDLRCSSALANFDTEIDVGIRFGPGSWIGLESRHLAEERLFPVASPSYRDGKLPSSLDDLEECALIQHPESTWRLWLEQVNLAPSDMNFSLAIDDSVLLLEAAAAGFGIALARKRLVQADLRAGRLVRLFAEDVRAEYSYWAVWNGSSAKRQLINAFVTWVSEQFQCDADPCNEIV